MTTFTGYVLSLRPRLLHPSWTDKYNIAVVNLSIVFILGLILGLPSTTFGISPLYMLIWTGMIPLSLFMRYCGKKESGELK